MSRHFMNDFEQAYHALLALSGEVEAMIHLSVKSLMERDLTAAKQVIDADTEIDQTEVRIEGDCLKMLALHQPVAADLRRLTTMMKINNDLERIADLSCNIAERASGVVASGEFPIPELIRAMAIQVVSMVQDALNSFVNLDVEQANEVILRDNEVDESNVKVIDSLSALLSQDPQWVAPALHCFSASRHLEQIADHATSIAEDVIYMVSGDIVRHQHNAPDSSNESGN